VSRHGVLGLRRWRDPHSDREGISFWCPGCRTAHSVAVKGGNPGSNWGFNGDYDKPVLTPSVRVYTPAHTWEGTAVPEQTLCHCFVGCNGAQPGEIVYLDDSSAHKLRGAHPLEPWPDHYGYAGED
jgi:hypothetical protein